MTNINNFLAKEISIKGLYLLFAINNNYYVLSTNLIKEIIKFREYTKVPDSNELVDGIIDIRETVATVIDLRRLFYDKIESNGYYIIVEHNSKLYAFIIDDVLKIVGVDEKNLEDGTIRIMINDKKFYLQVGKCNRILFCILDQLIKDILSDKIN